METDKKLDQLVRETLVNRNEKSADKCHSNADGWRTELVSGRATEIWCLYFLTISFSF